MTQELWRAARTLLRTPAYLVVAVLTLALGVGATTAIFSVVDAVLLKPLPYKDADRLVTIWEHAPRFDRMSVSYPDYLDWEQSQTALASLGCFRQTSFNLTGAGRPERVEGMMFSASLLPTLGLQPAVGRNFTADEDREGGAPVAMISREIWERRYGGGADVVGKSIQLGGQPYTIVGVLPRELKIEAKAEIATPIGTISGTLRRRGNHPGILAIGRLKPGVTLEQARADMERAGVAIGKAFPDTNDGVVPALQGIREQLAKDVRAMLLVLMGAVAFVLLVAVANVANLALARGTVRRKEMAVRAALGAGRLQLIRLVLVESCLVALLGGALGVVLALWGVDVLAAMRPDSLPAEATIHVDLRVLAFSLAVSLGSGILFGIVPALHAARADVNDALKDEARTVTAHGRTRNALVVAEVALALMLLVGAGLSLRAFIALARSDNGFVPDQVVTMETDLPAAQYATPEKVIAFHDELTRRVRALPGVAAATLSTGLPIAGSSETSYKVEGEPDDRAAEHFTVYYSVDGAYRETMGLRLLAGRFISDDDRTEGPLVVVIDDHMARTVYQGQDPIGKRIRFGAPDRWIQIVGVVGHVNHYGLGETEAAADQIYLPWRQIQPDFFVPTNRQLGITLRAQPGVDASSLVPAVAAAVAAIDADQPVHTALTMQRLLDDSVAGRRFAMLLLGVFAAIALALAAIGLYSVMSYVVAQRTHEVGVRIALGARPGDVERMVVGQGLRLTAAGLALGVAGAFALSGVMASILYGIRPTDPLTFAAVAAVLAAVALVACWLPARRAARVDPMVSLRAE